MHAAKGLEWKYVYLPSLNETVLPYLEADVEEERRLLYVSITRASDSVFLSSTNSRHGVAHSPSRFLNQLGATSPTEVVTARVRTPQAPPKPEIVRCSSCQAPLITALEKALNTCSRCPDPRNQQLEQELKAWRERMASELNQLPWLLLSDVCVASLAATKPQDISQLVHIAGMRETKIEQFGEEIVEIVKSYL